MNQVKRSRSLLALLVPIVFTLVIIGLTAWYLHDRNVAVLHPAGEIGQKEKQLIDLTVGLSVIVVVPVFALTIFIAWRYRETNPRSKKYEPEWDHSRKLESIWWGVPGAIILLLSVVTWVTSHSLDPYRPLDSTKKPLNVQVVAMDWKWLFVYPDLHVASVNMLHLPVATPINLQVTSDTVMNSFWIPSLGGQIYAMPGMATQLHLLANKSGEFYGSPANISGRGFSRMTFTARATSQTEFNSWVAKAQQSNNNLDMAAYNQLAQPSMSHVVQSYSPVQDDLFNSLVMKYMSHARATDSAGLTELHTHLMSGGAH
jgi:cytochrome o ubiquinol oxidase subunit 2